MFAPASTESRWRMSSSTSSWLLPSSLNGASISLTFTPRACSSSSARPVLRATVFISGTSSSSCSARLPMASLSSSEMPGSEEMLMVNEPSLNAGKKLLPRQKNTTNAITNELNVPMMTGHLWSNAHTRLMRYLSLSHEATRESFFFLSLVRR